MLFEQEMKLYASRKEEFLKYYEGQFVLIKGETFAGSYTTDEQAYEAGLEKFGNVPFLIQRVEKEKPIVRLPNITLGLLNAGW